MEREDWPALVVYLEKKIYIKKHVSYRFVKLLCDSYMLLSDFPGIERLQAFVRREKPSVLARYAAGFAAASIIQGKAAAAREFLDPYRSDTSMKNHAWIQWFYGFSWYIDKKAPKESFLKALEAFEPLVSGSSDMLVTGLSLYLLDVHIGPHEPDAYGKIKEEVQTRADDIRKKYPKKTWLKMMDTEKSEMSVVILGNLLDDVTSYLYP